MKEPELLGEGGEGGEGEGGAAPLDDDDDDDTCTTCGPMNGTLACNTYVQAMRRSSAYRLSSPRLELTRSSAVVHSRRDTHVHAHT